MIYEDNPRIVTVLKKMISKLDFEPSIMSDSKQATRIFEEAFKSDNKIDYVILDLTVPGDLSGKELLDKLRLINPHVKALLSSGYINGKEFVDYKTAGFDGLLPKPYTIESLRNALKSLQEQ